MSGKPTESGKATAATTTEGDNSSEAWDETKLQEGLDRLKDLHIQMRELRSTIPNLLRPIHQEQSHPETLYREFSRAATSAVTSVREFGSAWKDPKNVQVLAHARESKKKDPDIGHVAMGEGWLDKNMTIREGGGSGGGEAAKEYDSVTVKTEAK